MGKALKSAEYSPTIIQSSIQKAKERLDIHKHFTTHRLTMSSSNVRAYKLGEIHAGAAFTSLIRMSPSLSLQEIVNFQDGHRETMDTRPGMYLKYLPHRVDSLTGHYLTGGAYLFDTYENALDYGTWTTETYEVGEPKVKFWSQPVFQEAVRSIWRVIGAYNFDPVETHAVGRFQEWSYTDDGQDAVERLKAIYPTLKDSARAQGSAALWLLHQPDEKKIAIQLAFAKSPTMENQEQYLKLVERNTSLAHHFPVELQTEILFDRTSWFLSLWLPRSRLEGGVHQLTPNTPMLPAVTGSP
ncbi:hypothetical protein BDV26DRAFT_292604 [Aspergillus bertholletiae]|uniref:Uncharacterized protein n=1 Tax=Aspergillus bertholletiae TaxID=1226010 RepID=A0A5N7B8C5_9EURO|nr:hypothetical protein BDV26DRAFT_292604 [Aspergillus bertholletiae]